MFCNCDDPYESNFFKYFAANFNALKLKRLVATCYAGSQVAGKQLDLFETANIRLECPYRENQKDWKPAFVPFAKARKRIETLFSQLTDQFLVIRNYAKETCGLFARIIGKVSALTALQYINYINNKPIGRIKYALI